MTRQRGKSKSWKRPRSKPAFYLDENIPQSFGVFLRSVGYNVRFANESPGLTDLAQLRLAIHEQRIFVTHDRDFLSRPFIEHAIPTSAGVVIVVTDNPSDLHYQRLARQLLAFLDKGRIDGQTCVLSTFGARFDE